jgi:hypothetical protein
VGMEGDEQAAQTTQPHMTADRPKRLGFMPRFQSFPKGDDKRSQETAPLRRPAGGPGAFHKKSGAASSAASLVI